MRSELGGAPSPAGLLDASTRAWWRAVGRPIDLDDPAHAFLSAPSNPRGASGSRWLADLDERGLADGDTGRQGLLRNLEELDGPSFRADAVDPRIRDFYQRTAAWRMDVWTQWSPLFAPGGALVSTLFGRRVRQLALPMQPLAVSRGMDSEVRVVRDQDGARVGAAWTRTLRSDGSTVYSGLYRVRRLPCGPQPHVAVAFPLEMGHVHVFLRPGNGPQGSMTLQSDTPGFGNAGAYVSVQHGGRWHAALVPLRESFHLFVDEEDVLRTDHVLRVGRLRAFHMHFRMARV